MESLMRQTARDAHNFGQSRSQEQRAFLNTTMEATRTVEGITAKMERFKTIDNETELEEQKKEAIADTELLGEVLKQLKRAMTEYVAAVKSQANQRRRKEIADMMAQQIAAAALARKAKPPAAALANIDTPHILS